jgi:hypothetical protein
MSVNRAVGPPTLGSSRALGFAVYGFAIRGTFPKYGPRGLVRVCFIIGMTSVISCNTRTYSCPTTITGVLVWLRTRLELTWGIYEQAGHGSRLRYALPSLAPKPGSWVRIPLRPWMFSVWMCAFFLCLCTDRGLATSWSPAEGVLPTVEDLEKRSESESFMEVGQGPNWGCNAKEK